MGNETKKSGNPIHLLCPQCGGPARYHVGDRVYRCSFCGSETSPGEKLDSSGQWRRIARGRVKKDAVTSDTAVYSCPGCGANVIVKQGEALGTCSFCGGGLVRREYKDDDSFPESIIPFRIGEAEAKKILEQWNSRQGNLRIKKRIGKHVGDLKGYYLPYQFVRGPVECTVCRDMSHRKYQCGSYVGKIMVNASRQLKNEVLDAAEPFDMEQCRDFNFGYVAEHDVKMQDIDDGVLLARSEEEVTEDCRHCIEKTMHSKGLTILADGSQLEKLPVLLPMYVISKPGLSVAVNGQTGKVAVSLNETVDVDRFWFLEPLLTSLILGLLMFLFSGSLGLGLMAAVTVGAISFTAFGQDRDPHPILKVYSSGRKEKEEETVPVFREMIDGEMKNVDISFYPVSRVVSYLTGLLLFNVLPLLIAAFFAWCGGIDLKGLHYMYIGIWLVISIPMTFIFWTAYLRRDIFDRPVIRVIREDGTKERLRKERKSLLQMLKEGIGLIDLAGFWAGLLLFGLPALMFVMSAYLIYHG